MNAIVLSGGSAYGLAAASGVMRCLEDRFHSHRVGVARRANEALSHAAARFVAHFMEQTHACLGSDDAQLRRVFRSVEVAA